MVQLPASWRPLLQDPSTAIGSVARSPHVGRIRHGRWGHCRTAHYSSSFQTFVLPSQTSESIQKGPGRNKVPRRPRKGLECPCPFLSFFKPCMHIRLSVYAAPPLFSKHLLQSVVHIHRHAWVNLQFTSQLFP